MKSLTIITGADGKARTQQAIKLIAGRKCSKIYGYDQGIIENVLIIDEPTLVWIDDATIDDLMLPFLLQPTFSFNKKVQDNSFESVHMPMPHFIICLLDAFVCPNVYANQIEVINL